VDPPPKQGIRKLSSLLIGQLKTFGRLIQVNLSSNHSSYYFTVPILLRHIWDCLGHHKLLKSIFFINVYALDQFLIHLMRNTPESWRFWFLSSFSETKGAVSNTYYQITSRSASGMPVANFVNRSIPPSYQSWEVHIEVVYCPLSDNLLQMYSVRQSQTLHYT